jgi:hypothetical protein
MTDDRDYPRAAAAGGGGARRPRALSAHQAVVRSSARQGEEPAAALTHRGPGPCAAKMVSRPLLLLLLLSHSAAADAQELTPAEQARAACSSMNFTAKVGMMRGYGTVKAYPGYSRNSGCGGVCGRPQSTGIGGDVTAGTFRWDNGPQGFGDHTLPGTTTQWPSTLNMGATFDPELAAEWGDAMGAEFWAKGTNIQEGPGINIARVMTNGRNFEYISGEVHLSVWPVLLTATAAGGAGGLPA